MANVNLTIDQINNEALMILHQKLNFCTNIVTDYDNSFAQDGYKIGDSLRVRLPIQYSTGTGSTMATGTGADSIGVSTTLQVATQRHVPLRFTSKEMTMDIDSFSERHLKPAMTKLAAMIENDAFATLYPHVPNVVEAGTKVEFLDVQNAVGYLNRYLAPFDNRNFILDWQGQIDLVNDNKSLFQDQQQLSTQYKEGRMGRFAGCDFYMNTIIPSHTTGAIAGLTGTAAYLVNGAAEAKTLSASDPDPTSGTLTVDTGTAAFAAGDVIESIGDDVFAIHPETKVSYGLAKTFAVTAAASGAGDLTISPALISAGPHRNVSAIPDNNDVIATVGSASTAYKQSLVFQKGFACMGSADLVLPKNVEYASRQVLDNISMRIVGNYDIIKDRHYTRVDVLTGFKILRPELACRVWHT